MKISKLKELVDIAYEKGPDCDVEIWLHLDNDEEILCEIESVGQFNIVPDMTITFKSIDGKVISSEPLSEEQLDYKKRYNKLQQKINKALNVLTEEE